MNLQENIKRILKENRKPSNFLRRRLDMLDYEVDRGLKGPFSGANICIFFKSDVGFFESVMENSIEEMYYKHFSHIDDGSEEWAHEYLDMVDYIRKKHKNKIMKHYDDNCGSGSIPLKESIRKVLREELNESTYLRRRVDMSTIDEEFYKNLNIVTDRFLMLSSGKQSYSFNEFRTTVISYLIDDYRDNLSDQDYDNLPYDEVYEYLSNHFHGKIKDRYDEVFGGYINESKNIRRVLQEETNYLRMLLRRLLTETLDNIDPSQ